MRPKAVIDIDIPFLQGVLEPWFDVVYLKGRDISPSDVRDSILVVVRTRTKCDEHLLRGSSVRAVVSATIGVDHIDLEYCKVNNVAVFNAAGCNAMGVAQFVATSLFAVSAKKNIDINGNIVGIIGAGNTGERSAQLLSSLGFRVMRCDPPIREILVDDPDYYSKERATLRGEVDDLYIDRSNLTVKDYFTLSELLDCSDIISLHLPLNSTTHNIVSEDFIRRLKSGVILINSSRGEVVDERSLLIYYKKLGALILDVWNSEPNINKELLKICDIGTMHIAGYSTEGKINGTKIAIRKIGLFFGIEELYNYKIGYPATSALQFRYDNSLSVIENVDLLFREFFPIFEVDALLRECVDKFEEIRSAYRYRSEFPSEVYRVLKEIYLK